MNMNKVYFYIAALSIVIAGVWLSLPSDAERSKMQQKAQQRKAERAAKQKASPAHAASIPAASRPH